MLQPPPTAPASSRGWSSYTPPASVAAPTHRTTFRGDVEGLRAIAVLLVVAYHVGLPGVGGGFVGVDVFFVLSGYLITGILAREVERTGKLDLVRFYARRARRLLPGATLMLVATLLAGLAVFTPIERSTLATTAIATTLYASNLWFMRAEGDYFDQGSESNPLLHTWSLSVEEQFYFGWPIIVLLALRFGHGRRVRALAVAGASVALVAASVRLFHGWRPSPLLLLWPVLLLAVWRVAPRHRMLALTISALSVLSFLACARLTEVRQPWAFFASPTRAWEFGIGGLASLLPVAGALRSRVVRGALSWGGLAGIVGTALLLTRSAPFPGVVALVPVLSTVAVLVAGAGQPLAGAGRLLNVRPLQWLGKLSYSWYLWHWPVLVLAATAVPEPTLGLRLACAVVALGMAWVAYTTVENPLRHGGPLAPRPLGTLAGAVGLMTVGVSVALGVRAGAQRAQRDPAQAAFATAAQDRAGVHAQGCVIGYGESELRLCIRGDTTATETVVLLGDSHAAHWFPAVDSAARAQHVRLVTMLKAACPTARIPVYNPRLRRVEHECGEWRERALRWIGAHRPALVVLANSVGYVAAQGRQGGYVSSTPAEWRDGLRGTLASLERAGTRTLVIRDTPTMPITIPDCLSRAAEHPWFRADRCSAPRALAVDDSTFAATQAAAAGLPSVRVVDFTRYFCDGAVCPPVRDGRVLYLDSNHMTASHARALAPLFGGMLRHADPDTRPSMEVQQAGAAYGGI